MRFYLNGETNVHSQSMKLNGYGNLKTKRWTDEIRVLTHSVFVLKRLNKKKT